jgi:hypothetical protein
MLRKGISKHNSGEVPSHYEFKIRTKDGADRWVDCLAVAVEWEGKPAGLGTFYDVTARKLMEESLKESEQGLRRILDGIPLAIVVSRLSDDGFSTIIPAAMIFACPRGGEPENGREFMTIPSTESHRRSYQVPWMPRGAESRADAIPHKPAGAVTTPMREEAVLPTSLTSRTKKRAPVPIGENEAVEPCRGGARFQQPAHGDSRFLPHAH